MMGYFSGVQVCYTTVFGWYTSFLYLRTGTIIYPSVNPIHIVGFSYESFLSGFVPVGNILAPLSAHIFCNIMGLPDLHSVVQKAGGTFSCLVCGECFHMLMFLVSECGRH